MRDPAVKRWAKIGRRSATDRGCAGVPAGVMSCSTECHATVRAMQPVRLKYLSGSVHV